MPDIKLNKIEPNRLNPRLEFTKAGLDELSDSIKQVGLIEPIIVRPKDGKFEVVVGERRYRAAQQAGLSKVPAVIRELSDDEVIELNLIENIHREDLSAVEKGKACAELLEAYPERYSGVRALARGLGVSDTTVREWLNAQSMPARIQKLIAPETSSRSIPKGKIDYYTASAISRTVTEPERAAELVEEVANRRVPRRLAVQVAKEVERKPKKPVEDIFHEAIESASAVLPFSRKHADDILTGIKTQTSRKGKDPRIQPGAVIRASITHFADLKIKSVSRKRLGDFDEEDANREGGYSLSEFKKVWKRLHGEWDPEETVHLIEFELGKEV